MKQSDRVYWPFRVLPQEERDPHHGQIVAFLEAAFEAGHRPYTFDQQNFGAGEGAGRTVEIIHRGGNKRWEILFEEAGALAETRIVACFDEAARQALAWLAPR